jgi:aspartate beta-hydroxylase
MKNNNQLSVEEINQLADQAVRAGQSGRDQEAVRLWSQVLGAEPNHVPALTALGQRSFRTGDLPAALAAFKRLVEINPNDLQQWINLALICQGLKDEAGEERAIQGALTVDAMDLVGLILRANLLERQGKTHKAAAAYGAAATVSPALDRLAPDLRPAVLHAMAYQEKYQKNFGTFMDQYLDPHYQNFAGDKLNRFRDSIDILVGRKFRFESRSMMFHYPGLMPIEFFDRADFPWLDPIEAATDAIREEFLQILKLEDGFTPYITYPDDVPLNQWAELNNSPNWSAFHLYKMGEIVAENAAKCPKTMALMDGAPTPVQPGRTPAAMFSLLKPKTRIPPHTGVSNVRLVTHVPLIIPEGCGFRVGNTTRQWEPGNAWVFDDTIEHEAWNDSDKLRVVLIFDIWHPQLNTTEREMITAMSAGMNAFHGEGGGFDL